MTTPPARRAVELPAVVSREAGRGGGRGLLTLVLLAALAWSLAQVEWRDGLLRTGGLGPPKRQGSGAAAAAGALVPFELGLAGSGTLSGDIQPAYPTAGGPADGVLEVSFTFEVSGGITKA